MIGGRVGVDAFPARIAKSPKGETTYFIITSIFCFRAIDGLDTPFAKNAQAHSTIGVCLKFSTPFLRPALHHNFLLREELDRVGALSVHIAEE